MRSRSRLRPGGGSCCRGCGRCASGTGGSCATAARRGSRCAVRVFGPLESAARASPRSACSPSWLHRRLGAYEPDEQRRAQHARPLRHPSPVAHHALAAPRMPTAAAADAVRGAARPHL
eukprot:4557378-Prymnesium_polylepis.1